MSRGTKAREAHATCTSRLFQQHLHGRVVVLRLVSKLDIRQIHFNHHTQTIGRELPGAVIPEESGETHQIYRSDEIECMNEETGMKSARYAEVAIECCRESGRPIPFPDMAAEAGRYHHRVCSGAGAVLLLSHRLFRGAMYYKESRTNQKRIQSAGKTNDCESRRRTKCLTAETCS